MGGGIKFLGVFSGKQFDIPFISYRAIVNDIPMIGSFDIGGIPVWNIKHLIDVQDILRGTSSTTLSLEGVCASFNIPSPKGGEVSASNVSEMFWVGEIDKIAEYNAKDVLATCNAFCKYLRIPQVVVEIVKDVKVEEPPILTKLYNTKQSSSEVKEYLKTLKIETEEDKTNIIKIVFTNYQEKGEKVGVKKDKEKEVTDFINSLQCVK